MPVSLEAFKRHLNIVDDTTQDALLDDKLAAAATWIARYTGIPADAANIPADVQEATLKLAAHLYQNREVSLIGVTAQILPHGMLDLLVDYRDWVF